MLRKLKWLTLAILGLLAFLVCLQNLSTIQLRFLFSTIDLPLAAVLVSAMLIGFVGGLIVSALWRVHAWRARISREKLQQQSPESSRESPL